MKTNLHNTALQYPFPYGANPHSAIVEKKVFEWLETEYNFLPVKVKAKYRNTGIGHAGGCMFPQASLTQLTTICRFFIWAFTVDDSYEFTDKKTVYDFQKKAMIALEEGILSTEEALLLPLRTLRAELLRMGSTKWVERFYKNLQLYFEGLKEETTWRKSLVFPSFDEYEPIRIHSVNVYPLVNFAEAITGSELPESIYQHPSMQKIARLTCRILSWANDLFSAHLEKGKDVLNLVLIMENTNQCSLEDAFKQGVQIHDRDVSEFILLTDNLPSFGIYDTIARKYIENLQLMISGYLHWTLTLTERYGSSGHPSNEFISQIENSYGNPD